MQFFQSAASVETSLGVILETVHRHVNPGTRIQDSTQPQSQSQILTQEEIELQEKQQIDQLLHQIAEMDQVITENDVSIQSQTERLRGAFDYLQRIHKFNDDFSHALLSLTPMQEHPE